MPVIHELFVILLLALAAATVSAILYALKKALAPKRRAKRHVLARSVHNPILRPRLGFAWETEAVFNPAAVDVGGRVHLFYRALGADGVSRIGYASSKDGYTFDERLHYPVFEPDMTAIPAHQKHTSPARLAYDRSLYASGGGWGGAEDPRAVVIGDTVHLTFSMFNGWNSIRMTHTSIRVADLMAKRWKWTRPVFLSPQNSRQKNWVLFPMGITKRFAILHGISPIRIEHVDQLNELEAQTQFMSAPDHGGGGYRDPSRKHHWDYTVRGAGAPPIETDLGWLLFYQSLDQFDPGRYKVGAMILDREDPTKVLYRSSLPLLEPDMRYENDWKPGIVYASGAILRDDTVFIYYGGGDKTVSVATTPLRELLNWLITGGPVMPQAA
jgi:predicted GH43/DUF377 family glycosyl hydrolase